MKILKFLNIVLNPFYKPKFKVGDIIYDTTMHHFTDEPPKYRYEVTKVNNTHYRLSRLGEHDVDILFTDLNFDYASNCGE